MNENDLAHLLHVVEVSEWFDWLRMELPLGAIRLPTEETLVLFTERALHLADRVQRARSLPDSLRHKLIKASIIYQCWELRKEARLKDRPWVMVLREVTAISYLRPLGVSGRHHLVKGDDGCTYVITLSNGQPTDTLPATEIICTELARHLGLPVPPSAVVTVGPRILSSADANRTVEGREERWMAESCSGFEYVDAPCVHTGYERPSRFPSWQDLRHYWGAMVFDSWVLNWRHRKYAECVDPLTGKSRLVFFDHSHCFMDADWLTASRTHWDSGILAHPPVHHDDDKAYLRSWCDKARSLDLNPIYEVAFRIPSQWYGGDREKVAFVVEMIERRKWDLRPMLFGLEFVAKHQKRVPKSRLLPLRPEPRTGQYPVGDSDEECGQPRHNTDRESAPACPEPV